MKSSLWRRVGRRALRAVLLSLGRLRPLADVLGADLVGGEEAEEGRGGGGGLDGGAAVGFFALYDADDRGDGHAGFAGRFNGVDGGGAGGADIVDDEDGSAFSAETLNAAASAVGLFRFADEEAVDQRGAGLGEGAGGAGRGHVRDDGIGAEGEAADGFDRDAVLGEQVEDGVAGETASFSMKRGGAAVDVVVAGAAGGELELAEAEAEAGEQREQLLGVSWGGHH
jgi:hypothetical protein